MTSPHFRIHGDFSWYVEGRLLITDVTGPWNKELVESWAATLHPSALALSRTGPHVGIAHIHGRRTLEAIPGQHLAPLARSSGRNVYEQLGAGFTLLALGVDDAAVRAFEQASKSAGLPLTVLRDGFGWRSRAVRRTAGAGAAGPARRLGRRRGAGGRGRDATKGHGPGLRRSAFGSRWLSISQRVIPTPVIGVSHNRCHDGPA